MSSFRLTCRNGHSNLRHQKSPGPPDPLEMRTGELPPEMPSLVTEAEAGSFRLDPAIFDAVPWSFAGEDTGYATHGFHPYPVRVIQQSPQALIAVVSGPGDTVRDPFCGSGTTLSHRT